MLSNGFDATLHLKLRPSKILLAIRLIAHILALVAISLPLHMQIEIKVAVYFFIFISLALTIKNYKKTKHQQTVYRWKNSNQWVESTAQGDVVWSCLHGAMLNPWFLIVSLENADKKESIFIGRDQCSDETYRRLRVRLKYLSSPTQGVEAKSIDSR